MTKESLRKNIFQWSVMTALVVVACPDPVLATSAGDALTLVRSAEAVNVPPLINAIAYTIGAVLGVSGALKLKAHAEKPDQEKIAPGIARLLAGGAVASLPYVIKTAVNTLHLGSDISGADLASIS